MQVHAEFTGDDRITLDVGSRGIIIRYETYRQLGKVNYSVKGYEPFFEGEWLPIARYDTRKGYAQREVVRPTLAYSALGLSFKENWGDLKAEELFEKAITEIAAHWEGFRSNYDSALPVVTDERRKAADENLKLLHPALLLLIRDENARKGIPEGMNFTPSPKHNDWLLEQNTLAMARIAKKAIRGELTFRMIGDLRIITHDPHPVEAADAPASPDAPALPNLPNLMDVPVPPVGF
jgi:hypothetical protein